MKATRTTFVICLPLRARPRAAVFSTNASATTGPKTRPLGHSALEDGVKLRGRFFGRGNVYVILAHMYPADQVSWYPFAQVLAEAGYKAFTFDFRGYGVSEGEKVIPSIDRDLEAALELARARGATQVFLVGASMGGTAALKVAAREDVSGVVVLSAPLEFKGLDAGDDVSMVSEPLLLIASERDRSAAASATRIFEDAPGGAELSLLPGSAHGTDMLESNAGDEVRELLLEFLRTHTR
ncbi:MAG: alpha/beta fold hydrolase [Candidatus Neomarinimicrobiota bacterium]